MNIALHGGDHNLREYQSWLHSELAATFAYFGERSIRVNNAGDELGSAAIGAPDLLRSRAASVMEVIGLEAV